MPDHSRLISDAARDLIVAAEVSSKQAYEKRYRRPEWPGGMSGVTIGIGYDIGAGVKNAAQLRADWGGRIPGHMIEALIPCIGVTGERAHAMLSGVRGKVDVPWEAAIAVFDNVDVPRWYAICKRALPNFEELSPDCKGALLSLTYNRGASFQKAGERYQEMRSIRAHMMARDFISIPDEFRAMKRLWPAQRGLLIRRDDEARLFEKGLGQPAAAPKPIPTPAPSALPPKPVTPPVTTKTKVIAGGIGVGILGTLAAAATYITEYPATVALSMCGALAAAVLVYRFVRRA